MSLMERIKKFNRLVGLSPDDNPYREVTEDEQKVWQKNYQKALEQAQQFSQEYGALVQDQRYGLAYKLYQNFYQSALDLFLSFNETSTEHFYVVVKNIQLQLRTLTKIVNAPKDFAMRADEVIKRPHETKEEENESEE